MEPEGAAEPSILIQMAHPPHPTARVSRVTPVNRVVVFPRKSAAQCATVLGLLRRCYGKYRACIFVCINTSINKVGVRT